MSGYKYVFYGLLVMLLAGCASEIPINEKEQATVLSLIPEIKATELWQAQVGRGAGNDYYIFTPQVVEGKVYGVDKRGNVMAFNKRTGAVVWHSHTHKSITSAPGVGGHLVFVGTTASELEAFETQYGKKKWSVKIPSITLVAPAYSQGKVLVKTLDGQVLALDATTGKTLWHHQEGAPNLLLRSSSAIKIVSDRLIVGFHDGRIAMLKLANGDVIWQRQIAMPTGFSELERMVDIDVTPGVDHGTVYVADYQGRIVALRFDTGQPLWQHKISSYGGLVITAEGVVVGDMDGTLWSFNRNTGEVNWHQNQLKGRTLVGPVLYKQDLVVADNKGNIYWISQDDGHVLKRTYFDKSGVIAPPVVKDNVVYVMARGGKLAAFTS